MSRLSDLVPYLVATAVAAGAALTVLPQRFGAHPWWADQVVWVGLPIGLLCGFLLSRLKRGGMLGAIAFLLAAASIAHIGKLRFAASFAEDRLAGQLWYFGWIATCAAVTAVIVTLVSKIMKDRSPV